MTAVRPPIFPPSRPTEAVPSRVDPAKLAAQKAFFQAALGNAAPAAAPAAAAKPAAPSGFATARPAAQVQKLPDPAAEPPTRILRPGSLLDIKI